MNLQICVNQQYDIISNIDVEDGLLNGTECTVKYVEKSETDMPLVIWVLLENSKAGQCHRQMYKYLNLQYKKNLQWTPIFPIECKYLIRSQLMTQNQYPLYAPGIFSKTEQY